MVKWLAGKPAPAGKKPKGKAKCKAKAKAKAEAKAKAASQPSASQGQATAVHESTSTPFQLEDFLHELWRIGRYVPVASTRQPLRSAGSCSGSGSFEYLLDKMCKMAGVKSVSLYGCDWDKSAVQFMLRNRRAPKCVFEDRQVSLLCDSLFEIACAHNNPVHEQAASLVLFISRLRLAPAGCSRPLRQRARALLLTHAPLQSGRCRVGVGVRRVVSSRIQLLLQQRSEPQPLQARHCPSSTCRPRDKLPCNHRLLTAAEAQNSSAGEF